MNIFLIVGFIPESQRTFIQTQSVGAVQNAADSLQNGFAVGLSQCLPGEVITLNLPFVGSFPKRFKSIFYPSFMDELNGARIITVGFCNLMIWKQISRTVLVFRHIWSRASGDEWLVVYSVHPPFMIAALMCKLLNRSFRLCLIIPDLPEHMGTQHGLQGVLNGVFRKIFYSSIRFFDAFVVLTQKMVERIGANRSQCVVIEGISQAQCVKCDSYFHDSNCISILYSGTLAERYGVKNLVNAFMRLCDSRLILLICGDGDSRSYIEAMSRKDSRIRFLGQVDRSESLRLQRGATILVNPRLPGDEYTEYSFPSKIMEYMSSGRPVVMYRLAGIPEEYFEYCFTPSDLSVESLVKCLEDIVGMDISQLNAFGSRAQEFVFNFKNPSAQAGKLVDLLISQS